MLYSALYYIVVDGENWLNLNSYDTDFNNSLFQIVGLRPNERLRASKTYIIDHKPSGIRMIYVGVYVLYDGEFVETLNNILKSNTTFYLVLGGGALHTMKEDANRFGPQRFQGAYDYKKNLTKLVPVSLL